jgi:hypothetical protein
MCPGHLVDGRRNETCLRAFDHSCCVCNGRSGRPAQNHIKTGRPETRLVAFGRQPLIPKGRFSAESVTNPSSAEAQQGMFHFVVAPISKVSLPSKDLDGGGRAATGWVAAIRKGVVGRNI